MTEAERQRVFLKRAASVLAERVLQLDDVVQQKIYDSLERLYFEKEDWPNVIETLKVLVEKFPKREHWVRLAGVYGQEGYEKEQMYSLEAAYTAGFLTQKTDFTNLAGLLMQESG